MYQIESVFKETALQEQNTIYVYILMITVIYSIYIVKISRLH